MYMLQRPCPLFRIPPCHRVERRVRLPVLSRFAELARPNADSISVRCAPQQACDLLAHAPAFRRPRAPAIAIYIRSADWVRRSLNSSFENYIFTSLHPPDGSCHRGVFVLMNFAGRICLRVRLNIVSAPLIGACHFHSKRARRKLTCTHTMFAHRLNHYRRCISNLVLAGWND